MHSKKTRPSSIAQSDNHHRLSQGYTNIGLKIYVIDCIVHRCHFSLKRIIVSFHIKSLRKLKRGKVLALRLEWLNDKKTD